MELTQITRNGDKIKLYRLEDGTYLVKRINIPQQKKSRALRIYLPRDYFHDESKHYPVLYIYDGQNVFSDKTSDMGHGWQLNESLERMVHEHRTKGCIVVGIENAKLKRSSEYNPAHKGHLHAKFIVETLKPRIDRCFRTLADREHTGIAGSSAGGVMALYTGLKYQHVFSKIGAFSPAIFWAPRGLHNMEKQEKMKIYMDFGSNESEHYGVTEDYTWSIKWYRAYLLELGFDVSEIGYLQEDNGYHSEQDWARRFPFAYLWLYEHEFAKDKLVRTREII